MSHNTPNKTDLMNHPRDFNNNTNNNTNNNNNNPNNNKINNENQSSVHNLPTNHNPSNNNHNNHHNNLFNKHNNHLNKNHNNHTNNNNSNHQNNSNNNHVNNHNNSHSNNNHSNNSHSNNSHSNNSHSNAHKVSTPPHTSNATHGRSSFFKNLANSRNEGSGCYKGRLSANLDRPPMKLSEDKPAGVAYPPSVHFNDKGEKFEGLVDKYSGGKYQASNDRFYPPSSKYNQLFSNDNTQQRLVPSSQTSTSFQPRPAELSPFSLLVSPASSARISFLASKFLSPNNPVHQPPSNHSYPFSTIFNSPYLYPKSGFYPHLPHQPLDTNSGLEGSGCRLIEYRGAQVDLRCIGTFYVMFYSFTM